MNMQNLLKYTKEELARYILKNCFAKDIEEDMKHIHIQFLLDEDKMLSEKEDAEEAKILNTIAIMPQTTFEDKYKVYKMYEKYKKISIKNMEAYQKRQSEINKLMKIK